MTEYKWWAHIALNEDETFSCECLFVSPWMLFLSSNVKGVSYWVVVPNPGKPCVVGRVTPFHCAAPSWLSQSKLNLQLWCLRYGELGIECIWLKICLLSFVISTYSCAKQENPRFNCFYSSLGEWANAWRSHGDQEGK